MQVEVFTYDCGESYSYDITINGCYIGKLNKMFRVEIGDSRAMIKSNFKLAYKLSSGFYKNLYANFGKKYTNIKEAELYLIDMIKSIDEIFADKKHFDYFAKYDERNNVLLDILEGNPIDMSAINKKRSIDFELSQHLKPFFEKFYI